MIITRRQVLDAIRFEPLSDGTWVSIDEPKVKGVCRVCAVGATLRRAGNTDTSIRYLGNELSDLGPVRIRGNSKHNATKSALYEEHYLRALSIQYEGLAMKYPTPTVRKKLAVWVKANLPVKFKAEVG